MAISRQDKLEVGAKLHSELQRGEKSFKEICSANGVDEKTGQTLLGMYVNSRKENK